MANVAETLRAIPTPEVVGDLLEPDEIAACESGARAWEKQQESPIIAFQGWCERYMRLRGRPLTQDEYFLAQDAYFAAHPGEGPKSTLEQARSLVTGQEER